jgi:amino acid transporter
VWSPTDGFVYNFTANSVAVAFGIPLVAGTALFYPVRGLTIAILIAGLACLAEALVYSFLVSSMPRNGGDYLFQSRLIGPTAGTSISFAGIVVGGALWMGITGWFAAKLAIGPFLIMLGVKLEAPFVTSAGHWLFSTKGVVALGLVAVLWSALVNIRGMVMYARLQRVLTVVGLVAMLALVSYFALTKLSVNQSTYRGMMLRAVEAGYRTQGRSDELRAVVSLIPLAAFGLIYPGWVSFQAGEVRRSGSLRVQLASITGSKVFNIVFALVLLPLPIRHVGEQLFGASVYLALHDPDAFWVLAPNLLALNTARWLSWITLILGAVAINTWFWVWVPNHTLAASRVMLAMTWDRLLPRSMGELHSRFGTPVRTIVVFAALSTGMVVAYAWLGVWSLAVHATLVSLVTFAVTCAGATVFPFARRELYRESTAARFEILRVPLITVAGAVFVAFAGFVAWQVASANALYVNVSPLEIGVFLVAVYGGSLALHLLLRRYQRQHESSDIELYYRRA